jgi:hypothetical protein
MVFHPPLTEFPLLVVSSGSQAGGLFIFFALLLITARVLVEGTRPLLVLLSPPMAGLSSRYPQVLLCFL